MRKPRGRPFERGNPGRPRGATNKTTQMVESLAGGQVEQLVQKMLELAAGGDVTCLRMVMDRLWPVRKGRPVDIDLPPIEKPEDILASIAALWLAIGEGRLSADEAASLSLVADRMRQIVETELLRKRVEALEEAQRLEQAQTAYHAA